ncbi:hypothetical protein P7C73_g4985, partial [Tremellales sp. Uapishka_1]
MSLNQLHYAASPSTVPAHKTLRPNRPPFIPLSSRPTNIPTTTPPSPSSFPALSTVVPSPPPTQLAASALSNSTSPTSYAASVGKGVSSSTSASSIVSTIRAGVPSIQTQEATPVMLQDTQDGLVSGTMDKKKRTRRRGGSTSSHGRNASESESIGVGLGLVGHGTAPDRESRRTLWIGDLDGWMDEAYLRQTCAILRWDVVQIKLIRPPMDPTVHISQMPMNAGYCFLTFATNEIATQVLFDLTPAPNKPVILLPNTKRAFKANWASGSNTSPNTPATSPFKNTNPTRHAPRDIQEYSIVISSLAPGVTEAIILQLFLNPPQPIAQFYTIKGASILPGNASPYALVHFTSEEEQQRAVVEMQDVYCLTQRMHISLVSPRSFAWSNDSQVSPTRGATTLDATEMVVQRSVTTPIAQAAEHDPFHQIPYMLPSQLVSHPSQVPSMTHATPHQRVAGDYFTPTRDDQLYPYPVLPLHDPIEQAKALACGAIQSSGVGGFEPRPPHNPDPNNTTVFVGGLSSLVGEETLKSFFQPFGEITYVKIPPGKGCGFVQFVHKEAATRSIERMQGFPVGGTRIRLSWGRSQSDKTSQTAAQAAQISASLAGLAPDYSTRQILGALNSLGGINLSNAAVLRALAAMVPQVNAIAHAHAAPLAHVQPRATNPPLAPYNSSFSHHQEEAQSHFAYGREHAAQPYFTGSDAAAAARLATGIDSPGRPYSTQSQPSEAFSQWAATPIYREQTQAPLRQAHLQQSTFGGFSPFSPAQSPMNRAAPLPMTGQHLRYEQTAEEHCAGASTPGVQSARSSLPSSHSGYTLSSASSASLSHTTTSPSSAVNSFEHDFCRIPPSSSFTDSRVFSAFANGPTASTSIQDFRRYGRASQGNTQAVDTGAAEVERTRQRACSVATANHLEASMGGLSIGQPVHAPTSAATSRGFNFNGFTMATMANTLEEAE